jgi:hypothetical protein
VRYSENVPKDREADLFGHGSGSGARRGRGLLDGGNGSRGRGSGGDCGGLKGVNGTKSKEREHRERERERARARDTVEAGRLSGATAGDFAAGVGTPGRGGSFADRAVVEVGEVVVAGADFAVTLPAA